MLELLPHSSHCNGSKNISRKLISANFMTAIMDSSPLSSMSDHVYPEIHDDSSKLDMTHLSGMTMADFFNTESTGKEPQINLIHPSPPISQRSSMMDSKRASTSTTSTTKSQLRQTNQVLIQMLNSIQSELAAHRTIMLDIQHRVSHLEYESNASVNGSETPQAALQALEGSKSASRRSSKMVPAEGKAWWEACQNYARNAEPPMSAREFLRTPVRYSGFDFAFGIPIEVTPPATPPSVDDLPPLTPTSEDGDGEGSDLGTPVRHDISFGEDVLASTPKMEHMALETQVDIQEQTVEVAKGKMPAPPLLQPPPSGKPVLVEKEEEVVAAIEPEISTNQHRLYKGVRSLATYKALLRNKNSEKGKSVSPLCRLDVANTRIEHHVLIHFHRKADLKHLDD
jgi:hypothetical protein